MPRIEGEPEPAPGPDTDGGPSPTARRPPDLRLFSFALGTWAASLAAIFVPAVVAVAAAAVAASVAVAIGQRRQRTAVGNGAGVTVGRGWAASGVASSTHGPRHRAVRNLRFGLAYAIVAILLGLVCGALATAARTFARDSEPLASLSRQHVVALAELTVTDDPRRLRSTRPGPPTYLVPARLTALRSDHIGRLSLDVRVVVFGSGDAWRSLLPSQRVAASTRLDRADGGDLTAAVLSATGDPQPLTAPSWLQRAAGRLRAGLQAACRSLPPQPGGLLPGLVIGDVSRLDPALVEEFRETGLTHLTAVSGANLAIMLGVVLFLARWCRAGPVTAMLVCAAAVVGFVVLARPSPSVIRAAAMGSVGLLALASGRAHAAPPSLAVAVTAGLLIDPGLAVDAGFALSALATGALVLVAPRWRDALRRRGVPPMIAEALAVPAAAQVLCAPIIAAISGSVSVAAILANLLAAPAVAPATLLGIGAALLSALWLDGAAMLAWLASWPARWLVEIAHVGAALPVGSFPWPTGLLGGLSLAGLTAAAFIVGRRPAARRALVVVALGIAVGTVPIRLISPGWPPDGSVVVACDVGQGDAVVLPVAPGRAVVIDAGPDPAAVDGCLNRLGVRTVDALLLTHFHVDHIGGLAGVLRGRQVRSLVLPAFREPPEGRRTVLAAVGAVPTTEAQPGWHLARGTLDLTLIGPVRPLTGTRSDPNNNSLVLRAVNRGVTVLLTGDAETEEQHELLSLDPNLLRADVLKVAHHGSAFQEPALLDAIDPQVALVSVGAGNRYGHPNPALLDRLSRSGARIMRTDRDGDIAAVASADGLGVAVNGAGQAVAWLPQPSGRRGERDEDDRNSLLSVGGWRSRDDRGRAARPARGIRRRRQRARSVQCGHAGAAPVPISPSRGVISNPQVPRERPVWSRWRRTGADITLARGDLLTSAPT